MSWHCSQELAAEFLQAGCLDIESYVLWKKIRSAERSCFEGKSIKKSKLSPYGTISTHSMGDRGMASLMSSLLDSHVKDLALLANGKANKTPVISGQKHLESFQKSGHPVSSSKMFPELEDTFQELSRILPLWGTTRNGAFCPLEKSEHLISGKDGGLWPTPRASNPSSRINSKGGKILQQEVRIAESKKLNWPTPSATDSGGGTATDTEISESGTYTRKNKDGVRWGVPLRDAVPAHEKKWPTPTASDYKGGVDTPRKDTGRPRNDRLDHCLEPYNKGKLNPDWVEWLMGWPIGWTSLDPLDTQLALWWKETFPTETYWEIDPSEVPWGVNIGISKLTNVRDWRSPRLKCCGNGQVPHQVRLAVDQLEK